MGCYFNNLNRYHLDAKDASRHAMDYSLRGIAEKVGIKVKAMRKRSLRPHYPAIHIFCRGQRLDNLSSDFSILYS